MIELFGRRIEKPELLARVGSLAQVAGIRMMELQDGVERGVRIADVRTGSGLRFQFPSTGGWTSPWPNTKGRRWPGAPRPAMHTPRTLTARGRVDPVVSRRAHDRLRDDLRRSSRPGRGRRAGPARPPFPPPRMRGRFLHALEDGQCRFRLDGSVRESAMFRENLLLRRTIETTLGSSVITLRDRVTNEGHSRSPLMMLYHVNAGWPLVDAGTRLLVHARESRPRDADAARGAAGGRRLFRTRDRIPGKGLLSRARPGRRRVRHRPAGLTTPSRSGCS